MPSLLTHLALRYHRWLGLMAALPLMLWGLSGLSHPLMSRLQPPPAATTPPTALQPALSETERQALPPLATLLADYGIVQLQAARLLSWQGRPVWQLTVPGQAERVYVDAREGGVLADVDRRLAEALAAHFAGQPLKGVLRSELVTEFSADYPAVNRLLPVWRVDFNRDDGLRAYVETAPARLTTLDDDRKALWAGIFRQLHSWGFIATEALRETLMALFLLSAFAAALGGLWLYGCYWRQPAHGVRARPLRRGHRLLGVVAGLTTLTFTGSGLLHLLLIDKTAQALPQPAAAEPLPVVALTASPGAVPLQPGDGLQLLALEGEPVWRISPPPAELVGRGAHTGLPAGPGHAGHAGHGGASASTMPSRDDHYVVANTGRLLAQGARRHAAHLASRLSGRPVEDAQDIERITRFEGEYGFINKRLPVYRVRYGGPAPETLYVEPATGVQAAVVRSPQRFEGYVFAWLHKWQWLPSRNWRDALTAAFALLNVLVAALGLALWGQRLRTAQRPKP